MTRDTLIAGLQMHDSWTIRAIIVLYNNQTFSEQQENHSFARNKKGFSKWDAPKMTCLAKAILKGYSPTQNELIMSRKLLPKYSRQLLEAAQAKSACIRAASELKILNLLSDL